MFLCRCACLLLLWPLVSTAQTTPTANQAYQYLQNERARVRQIIGTSTTPLTDSLKKGAQVLQEALAYYQRPDILALTKTNKSLYYRKTDILYDLSRIQSRLNDQPAAVASLQQLLTPEFADVYAPWILDDSYLTSVRQDPALKPILDKAAAGINTFRSKALTTPYQPNLSDDEKVAGLSKMWAEAKYNFAYFDHIPDVDWDRLYLEYLPKVRATPNTVAYYRVLKQFYAQLRDGHTDVWAPSGPLADSVAFRPPVVAQLVEGRVFVQQVRHDSLMRSGIIPGLEIVQIDGLPVRDYADRYVRPYQSGSTPQNIDVQTYGYQLLRGPKDRPVTVMFRDARGKTFSRALPRSGYSTLTPVESVIIKYLPGNVAYVQLNEFESNRGFKRFVAAFDTIAAANALILDVRQNGGGDSGNGWNILSYLTDKPFATGSYRSRVYSPVRRARGENVLFEPVDTGNTWAANREKLFSKPVAVLIGGMTFSAAEDFTVAFAAMKRGKLIGEPTGGSTGQPLGFSLPGGIMARVCTKRDAFPDGTEWVGKGIQPDILIRPTAADVLAGRDPALDAALRELAPPVATKPARKTKSSR
ncbi:hypothetical protein DYU11_32260 [Fibrisoma montanum]|uniref:Tail specific protease domain-containing protein n=1 Tax=Fibrisoma montanum TaxID=2305895 RepID=A0A418LVU4_9BACT|nr:S41 family peptidase [Fibrisoma montanum]RIV17364.1 hypothetical protein DYU11_32260 [Fibrisoma montanum]